MQAVEEVGDLGRLLSSAYGIVLLAKSLGVAAMVALSLLAWRRLRVSLRIEAVYAVVVIGASALLAAYPLPPARAAEADALAERPEAGQVLPQTGDLTLGGSAGETLVGLTLRPGKPGPNVAWIYLLPIENPAAVPRGDVRVDLEGRPIASRPCGLTCQIAELQLQGGESLTIALSGRAGGKASFRIPALPAADGSALVEKASQRMEALRTYRIEEVLGPAALPLRTLYAFQAPDRLRFQLSTGPETVIVGGSRFSMDRPSGAWRVEPAVPVKVPSLTWEPASFLGTHLIGSAQLAGQATQVVAFFEMLNGFPVWFRLWIDGEGLVWRAEMRAQGHFMDDGYRDFDAPFTIEPPPLRGP
ncbi:CopD family protein [Candidatus Nephthysia bennettiae]